MIRHIFRKLLVRRYYNKYVINRPKIQEDVKTTVEVRGCKVSTESLLKQFEHLMMYYPEYGFIFFWRIGKPNSSMAKYFTKDFNCKIFASSEIKGGLNCFHPFASVINAKTIGKNFQFRNGLTIGNKNNDNSLLPRIGNNVNVGANVVIIGDIEIGDNVIIGAGSVVVKDVPSNSVIAGNPAQVIGLKDE